MTSTSEPWGARALCRPELGGNPTDWDDTLDDVLEPPFARKQRHAKAKAVCARCPVRRNCEDTVDLWRDSGIRFGIHLEAWREAQGVSPQPSSEPRDEQWSA